ncbi:MAG: class I tRNA ligase family protein, partial [Thermoplasmata archaeon]|nr:class I tRNA ligase family protein [Thermoplasmata archaeon]
MPGGTIEILEERPGSAWAGTAYRSPLADSVPALRELPAPAGTVQATPEVNDAGTGIVTMTPAHGPADAQLGRTLHWPGPDVLRADGMIGGEPRHKYTGLPLDTAEACVLRELLDDGFVFAELRVHRGVPHCLVCSQPTVWRPGTAWSLDLGRLPQGVPELYARLLPEEPLPAPSELLAWPVSDGIPSSNPKDPALRLCPACGRLSPSGSTGSCKCGQAAPAPVRQGLRSPFAEPLSTWLRLRAANVAGPTWLFLPARRRAPALLHELLAAWATGPLPGRELRLQSVDPLPGEPTELDIPAALPAEAARITLLKLVRGRSSRRSFQDSVTEEARWLARLGTLLVELHEEIARDGVSLPAPSAPLRLGELLPEDLAMLARFERLRARVISEYDRGEWEAGFSQLVSFIDRELRDGYLRLTRPRRTATLPSASRLAVARVIALLLSRLSELLAPVLPFTSEAVHRDTPEEDRSLFERRITPVQESLLDADAERSLPVWEGLVASLDRARDGWGVSRSEPLPQLVLVAVRDEDSARLLPQLPVLARLAGAVKVEVFGPSRPWTQRRVSIRFDKEAIRQAYPVYHRRILSMLETLDPKRVREAVKSQTLAVAIEGQPAVRIAPSMVEVVETLPERFVSFTWPGGEAYAELPAGAAEVRAPRGGHLPAEVDRIAIHLKWRLRARAGAESPAKAFICAPEPIAAEVQRNAATLAERSGLAQVLRVDSPRLFLPAETSSGRSRRGHEWQVWVPGLRTPTRAAKHRSPKKEDPLRIAVPTTLPAGVSDMLAEPVRERATGIQELLAALDARCNLAAL